MPDRLAFQAMSDDQLGDTLGALFCRYWPSYRRWMRNAPVCPVEECVSNLRAYMPELLPVYERLLGIFHGDASVARFLTLYRPPPVVRGCSQLVIDDDGPALIRSYDHHPNLFDGVLLATELGGGRTMAMTDCLWGALDGINEHGLAVALAFGGRNVVGDGFGAPLVVRYVLETCSTIGQAKKVLARVPVYMSYTFVMVDRSADFVTVHVDPHRSTRCITRRASANHQFPDDWPAYCEQSASIERLTKLEALLGSETKEHRVVASFLQPPLWRTDYKRGSGTLYVASYRPQEQSVTLHWPATESRKFSLRHFCDRTFSVDLDAVAAGCRSMCG